eukprot:TRINITY_DN1050_c0_g1_i1.p1 TRINITY_DN1050_c0_g1~~TRINITY_DN1050_c0_g1_i1.p1  ORF type:complete len:330 (-),score=56.47 TRINITY_DN1050_c0_g1_i1:155-1099(-)
MALVALVVAAIFGRGDAWGPDGHTIIAHIADYYLSPEVANILKSDLYNVSLNNASDWCDDFDHSREGEWSAALHFINYKGHACKFDWAADCKDDWCNAGAIVNYSKQIFSPGTSKIDRFFALKFVIHMVGDIHQPLHVANGDDRGGNMIKLGKPLFSDKFKPEGSKTLHGVWDTTLLVEDINELANSTQMDWQFVPTYHNWTVLAKLLEKRLDNEWASKKDDWQAVVSGSRDEAKLRDGLAVVADESAELGCTHAYNHADGSAVKSGEVLQRDYFLRAQPVVEEQLAKGGVRLAILLEEALAKSRAELRDLILV